MGKRFWSIARIQDMLAWQKIVLPRGMLSSMTDDHWNELGDWLYYECHPEEPRSKHSAFAPTFIEEFLPRKAKPKRKRGR